MGIRSNIKNKLNNQKILNDIEKFKIELEEVRKKKLGQLTETEYRSLEVDEAWLLNKIEQLNCDIDFNNLMMQYDTIDEKKQRKKINTEEYHRMQYGIGYHVIELCIRRNESNVAYYQKALDYRNWLGHTDDPAKVLVQSDLKKAQKELEKDKALFAKMKKNKEILDNTIDVKAEIIDVTEVETRMSTINEQIGNIRQATIEAKKEKFKEKEKE